MCVRRKYVVSALFVLKGEGFIFPFGRDEQLASLQSGQEYDILVIGGGITGCGVALDSISRGNGPRVRGSLSTVDVYRYGTGPHFNSCFL